MIGIYEDSFEDFLRNYVGNAIKITSSNITIRCPWCEWDEGDKKHYHLNISTKDPVFNCLRAGCNHSGILSKLFARLTGNSYELNKYVDKQLLKDAREIKRDRSVEYLKLRKFSTPTINRKDFIEKIDYLKFRFHYAPVNIYDIHGLIVDPIGFFKQNNIELNEQLNKSINFLQRDYVGFLTENHTSIIFRNINKNEKKYRFRRISLQPAVLLDYYKLKHDNEACRNSNTVVIAEGIFDIFDAHIFNYSGMTDNAFAFYCSLNNRFSSLLKSIAYFDNMYKPNVVILSDSNIKIEYYKRIRRFIKHLCNHVHIYYNISGGDFGDAYCTPTKIVI